MFSTRRIIAVRRRHDYDTGQQCAVPSQSNWIREDTNGLYALTVQALDGPAFLGLSGVGIAVEGFSSSRNASVEGHGDHGPGVLGFCFNSFGAGGQSGSAAVLPLEVAARNFRSAEFRMALTMAPGAAATVQRCRRAWQKSTSAKPGTAGAASFHGLMAAIRGGLQDDRGLAPRHARQGPEVDHRADASTNINCNYAESCAKSGGSFGAPAADTSRLWPD